MCQKNTTSRSPLEPTPTDTLFFKFCNDCSLSFVPRQHPQWWFHILLHMFCWRLFAVTSISILVISLHCHTKEWTKRYQIAENNFFWTCWQDEGKQSLQNWQNCIFGLFNMTTLGHCLYEIFSAMNFAVLTPSLIDQSVHMANESFARQQLQCAFDSWFF